MHLLICRIEININEADDPTRTSEFKYDRESNKFIKFIHTDVRKDAGQTTIPLLDSQAVEAKPSFPLGGIGLSFRGRDGYGGYISPRIYTYDITQCINIEMINQVALEDLVNELINSSRTEMYRSKNNTSQIVMN